MRRFLLCLLVLFVMGGAWGQSVVLTTGSPTYPQDFNSLSSTLSVAWVDNGTIPSWYAASLNLGANGLVIGTGSSATGNLYNYGSTSAIDRTLGSLASGGTGTLNYGVLLSNGSSAPIVSLRIQYTGEQWRNGGNTTAQTLSFDYSTTSTVINSGTYTSFSALNFTSPIATAVASALDGNVGANRISFDQTITGLSIPLNSTIMLRWTDLNDAGNDHGLGIDDITITATFSSNTITTGTVLTPPFILATCATPMVGTVGFSFAGTFNASNIFTAQLSDDIGSFASPTAIGTLPFSGTDPGGLLIPIIIPAGTPGGTGYLIRVIADDPSTIGSSSSPFIITQLGPGGCASSHSDYYRSFQTGDWGTVSTWQSSNDNTNWIPATLSPTSLANIISIRLGHIVSLTSSASADQLVIESGGTLVNNMAASNAFTIANGGGDDIDIKGGGMYQITSGNGYAGYQTVSGGATVHIELFGIIRIGSGGALAGGNQNSFAITPTTYIWDTGSIFDWNTTSLPGTSGAVFFPDATAFVVPVWRFTAAPGAAIGGGSFLVVNGVLEANTDVIFDATSNKTFRNGILGTGNVTLNAGLGRLIVDGDVVGFGGTGTIIPNSLGLQVGGTLITTLAGLISNKTVTGDIVLYAPATSVLVDLGAFNLTVSGTIIGGSSARYIKTSGAGVLKLSAIAPAAFKDFPIGNTSYNPLRITNGSLSAADFNARVATGINNPTVAFPTYGVNRTWYIGASAITTNVTVTYQYAAAELGINITPADLVEILQSDYTTWSIIPGNINISQAGSDPYTVTTTAPITINNTSVPYAVGKNGGWILPIDCIISTRAQKRNNTGIISWTVNSCAEVNNFEVQRSVNNSGFRTIGTVHPVANQTDFSFTDPALAGGTNLYRIKVNGFTGSSKYSNTVALIHNSNDILISSLAPNPVHNKAMLVVSSGRNTVVDFKVYNMSGSLVKQWQSNIAEGNNTIEVNLAGLSAGIHSIFAYANGATTISRFVKQ